MANEFLTQNNLPSFMESGASSLSAAGLDAGRLKMELDYRSNLFRSQFRNLVGRDPTDEESRRMFTEIAPTAGLGTHDQYTQQQLRDTTAQYVGDTFSRQAEQQVNQELQGQQAEANRLGDLFVTQGNQTADKLSTQLQDFVQRTFEKIRPNLITSAQAQGLLNSGALDMQFAGAAKDLASSAQDKVFDYRMGMEDQANQIRMGGAMAPYQFQQAQALGRMGNLQGQSQNAIQQLFQQRMSEQSFQNQMGLQNNAMRIQQSLQPSFLRTMGQSTASSLGNSFGQWVSPATAKEGAKAYMTGGASLGA